jgi:lipooligosaccharide transport system ATP-binding protein
MRRRLTIARALVNHPDLLLLDEPTTGLDPQARHLLWGRLDRLREEGVTLVLTTHYMDEAEQLCDRILVIDGGRVVADGAPRALIAAHVRREVLEVRDGGDPRLRDTVLQLLEPAGTAGPAGVEELPGRLLVPTDDADSLADHLAGSGVRAHLLHARRATLEDVFLTLTGRALVD